MAEKSNLHQLSELGQSVWIDYLSRDLLESGELERMMRDDAVVGVTSNPTIFQKAISKGSAYDEQLKELLEHETDPKEIFLQLSARDIDAATDLLAKVNEGTDGQDGYVSWEVDPTLAYDREATYDEMVRLHEWIDKPNLYVKIPATKPGLGAIEDAVAAGRNINVTLIFSLQRYREVVEAYIRGLERRGKLAIANAKLAYQHYKETFSGPRWDFLEGKGATKQRCLWASTSTKNPAYSDVLYVENLIGPETVNTMPEETIKAFQDHGKVAPTLEQAIDEARRVFEQIAAAGVDYDD